MQNKRSYWIKCRSLTFLKVFALSLVSFSLCKVITRLYLQLSAKSSEGRSRSLDLSKCIKTPSVVPFTYLPREINFLVCLELPFFSLAYLFLCLIKVEVNDFGKLFTLDSLRKSREFLCLKEDCWTISLCLRICSCLACVYRVRDARGKFGEHEKCVRVTRGAPESNFPGKGNWYPLLR